MKAVCGPACVNQQILLIREQFLQMSQHAQFSNRDQSRWSLSASHMAMAASVWSNHSLSCHLDTIDLNFRT